jgi:glutathione S-transferase
LFHSKIGYAYTGQFLPYIHFAMASNELPNVKLFWLEKSRSQRILWLLQELKLPYELEIFHRNKQTFLAPPELQKIHPLGKSPVIQLTPAGAEEGAEPITLAESGFITQYLTENVPEGKRLMPSRWKEGMEGKIGGETEMWMRYQYYLHYCEGTLMPPLVMGLVIGMLKSPMVPFFIRPISTMLANRVISSFIAPNLQVNLKMIEGHLATSGGDYICGTSLTSADILLSFPLIASEPELDKLGTFEGEESWKTVFPKVAAYVEMIKNEEGYKKSVEKIIEIDGKFKASL